MISAVRWVPGGVCSRVPERYEISPEELKAVQQQHSDDAPASDDGDSDSSATDDAVAQLTQKEFLDALDLDNYDDDGASRNRRRYTAADDVVVDDADRDLMDAEDLGDDSDREDYELRDSDRICVVARADDDEFSLEMQVYDSETGTLFVHHDFILPSFPLCLQWLGQAGERSGSFVAVGTFQPEIEIWNLDVIDVLEPVGVLSGHHTDAILSLSWTPIRPGVLAAGSADKTISIWDLPSSKATSILRHHTDKVQSLEWHPVEAHLLATGGYDRRIHVVDCRTAGGASAALQYEVAADVEQLRWNEANPAIFAVSTEDGRVRLVDVRRGAGPDATLLDWAAHDGSCTAVAFSAQAAGLMATGGTDKNVKIWDVAQLSPDLIMDKDLKVGDVFSLDFNDNDPMLLAAGGSGGVLALWHIDENAKVLDRFPVST